MASGITASQLKNNRMMILDEYRFFGRERVTSQKLENYGRFFGVADNFGRIMRSVYQ